MKVKTYDSQTPNLLLAAMLTRKDFIPLLCNQWGTGLFTIPEHNLIGGWAVEWYSQYKTTLMKGIESRYLKWAKDRDDAQTKKVETLIRLLQDYADLAKNHDRIALFHLAEDYFTKQRVKLAIEQTEDSPDIKAQVGIMRGVEPVDLINNGASKTALDGIPEGDTFPVSEPLIIFPHEDIEEAYEFYGETLCRDGFLCFLGPEKSGKTWFLMDIAFHSILNERKTVYISIGDLSEGQMFLRWHIKTAELPKEEGEYDMVSGLICDKGIGAAKPNLYKAHLEAITPKKARKAALELQKDLDGDHIRFINVPNGSVNSLNIKQMVEELSLSQWTPDVVVIDYADLMTPFPRFEGRDAINENWKMLRNISQEYNCLVVTASQADSQSYDKGKLLGMQNFSEDKRKHSHVTGMIGINPQPNPFMTVLNWIHARDHLQSKILHCGGQKAIGQVMSHCVLTEPPTLRRNRK